MSTTQETVVKALVEAAVAPLVKRVAELEAATVSHIAQTVAGGDHGGHYSKFFAKFKHLLGIADAVVAVAESAGVPPGQAKDTASLGVTTPGPGVK